MGSVEKPAPSSGWPQGFLCLDFGIILAMKEEKEGPETGSCAGKEGQQSRGARLCLESAHTKVHQLQVSVIAETK